MPTAGVNTLHAYFFGKALYAKAAIVPYISELPTDRGIVYDDLVEPLVSGYVRHEADDIRDLFATVIDLGNNQVRLVSRPLEYRMGAGGDVWIRGLALVIYPPAMGPFVLCQAAGGIVWQGGKRIVARLTIESSIL